MSDVRRSSIGSRRAQRRSGLYAPGVAADRRTGILDAAISMIARRGVRGLRVEEVAAEAGVAVSLIYYYFGNRIGLVRATLEHANERAAIAFAVPDAEGRSGRELVETTLLSEFDDDDHVRETSAVWGEVVGSAAFEPELREHLREASDAWLDLITSAIERGIEDGSIDAELDARASATRLTAMVDGLSARWLAGLLAREDARTLLAHTIAADLRSQSSAARDLP
jgi:AcrR family transcriptional regulator